MTVSYLREKLESINTYDKFVQFIEKINKFSKENKTVFDENKPIREDALKQRLLWDNDFRDILYLIRNMLRKFNRFKNYLQGENTDINENWTQIKELFLKDLREYDKKEKKYPSEADMLNRRADLISTYEDFIELREDMLKFLKEDHPIEEKRKISPLGGLEGVNMMINGMEYERGIKRPFTGKVLDCKNRTFTEYKDGIVINFGELK